MLPYIAYMDPMGYKQLTDSLGVVRRGVGRELLGQTQRTMIQQLHWARILQHSQGFETRNCTVVEICQCVVPSLIFFENVNLNCLQLSVILEIHAFREIVIIWGKHIWFLDHRN